MPKQYEINTMLDFLKVPHDRLDACLVDFRLVLDSWRALTIPSVSQPRGNFIWIDDGKHEATARVIFNGEEIGRVDLT